MCKYVFPNLQITSDLDKVQFRMYFFFVILLLVQYDKKKYRVPTIMPTDITNVKLHFHKDFSKLLFTY